MLVAVTSRPRTGISGEAGSVERFEDDKSSSGRTTGRHAEVMRPLKGTMRTNRQNPSLTTSNDTIALSYLPGVKRVISRDSRRQALEPPTTTSSMSGKRRPATGNVNRYYQHEACL